MGLGMFTTGSIWSDGATPPAAKVLTTGFVVGDEIFIGQETLLSVSLVLSGTAPTSIELQLEQSLDGGTTWIVVPIGGLDQLVGSTNHIVQLLLTQRTHYRFSAKRTGGDGTTALLATGEAKKSPALPGRFDENGALLVGTGGAGSGTTISVDGDGSHVEETLLDLTNIATNTTGYGYLDMDGYRYFTLQGETSGTTPTDVLTVTVEASVQDDGTAAASCAYQDVTNGLFGVASWVDTDFMAVCDVPVAFKYVRIKYVTSNDSGDDCDLTVYAKRMW